MLEWIGKRYMRMQRVRHEEQGFTLIELLIVIIIIGILAAIAIPVFLQQRLKAQQAAAKSDARNAGTAQVLNYAAFDTFTDDVGPGATNDLYDQGFRRSDQVFTTIDAAKTDATNYCVETHYGNPAVPNTFFYITDDSGGVVQGANCP